MRSYATLGDYVKWTSEDPPHNIVRLIRSASLLVEGATTMARSGWFPDTSGPADGRDSRSQAMADAVCSQVATWVQLGVDPAAGPAGASGVVQSTSSSIGGASVTKSLATYASQAEERARSAASLTSEAMLILRRAGLLGQPGTL